MLDVLGFLRNDGEDRTPSNIARCLRLPTAPDRTSGVDGTVADSGSLTTGSSCRPEDIAIRYTPPKVAAHP